MSYARMQQAQLQGTKLSWSNLTGCDFTDADMEGADLSGSYLGHADLSRANLENARFTYAHLIKTKLRNARLVNCRVYGVSAWDVDLTDALQRDLNFTGHGDVVITVDNLEIAQFISLLLSNKKIRDAIDAITSKVVLILGRFADHRKDVLDAIRDALPSHGYVPVLFDFKTPESLTSQETVTLLARLARFVIADITEPASVPQELLEIVMTMPSLPIQPILQSGSRPWGMYDHILKYRTVLKYHQYEGVSDLLSSLKDDVIGPAELALKTAK